MSQASETLTTMVCKAKNTGGPKARGAFGGKCHFMVFSSVFGAPTSV